MVQIPIISGVYATQNPELRQAYPVNLIPDAFDNGISGGTLVPAEGLVEIAETGSDTISGADRGGIEWDGICYRVAGPNLIRVGSDNIVTTIGGVETDNNPVSMTYSFDRLAIASNQKLWYWDGTTLVQVTDPDLGPVLDVVWVDGYFATTDGEFIVVTELLDPTQVDPLKYGSSEADPDPVVALKKIRNELIAVNRHTIEFFDNVGVGSTPAFPFQRIEGAQIQKGCVGTKACCVADDVLVFLGGGLNERVSIYAGVNGSATRLASQEIDDLIAEYSPEVLAQVVLEYRADGDRQLLYVHLPDRAAVYDFASSRELGQPVWFYLTSSETGFSEYQARFFVRAYGKWIAGDPTASRLCTLSDTVGTHYGQNVRWEVSTLMLYNEGRGAIVHRLELVALTGSAIEPSYVRTSSSQDGVRWTTDASINVGGPRGKRLVWFRQGQMRQWRIQRIQATTQARLTLIRLEAQLEGLAY